MIHRSTLRYRLRRTRELTNVDLADVDTRLNLHLIAPQRQAPPAYPPMISPGYFGGETLLGVTTVSRAATSRACPGRDGVGWSV